MNTEDIIKSTHSKRTYKAVQLENKLTCFIIHDPETEKSACSLNVGVGAALDPKTHQGAAHFLEHMLF
jgi:secreted Zn-dependent insulinase-like peptidase